MMLWLILTAMISVAAVLVSAPFIRGYERRQLASAREIAVHRDQLREIENDTTRGLIDKSDGETTANEIRRRILAAVAAEQPPAASLTSSERKFALTVVTTTVVFGSVALYALVGNPDVPAAGPGQAASSTTARSVGEARSDAGTQAIATLEQMTGQDGRDRPQQSSGLPPVEEMIQRVQTRLERNPRDADGWRLLGWSLFNIERFAEAAQAYGRATELRPGSAEYRSARGEALVRAADGTVTSDAHADFDEALRLDPKDARARFFIGVVKEQEGDKKGAMADWTAIVSEADPNEPWLPDLKQRLDALRRELGENDSSPSPVRPDLSAERMQQLLRSGQTAASETAEPHGPRAADIRKAEMMSTDDRNLMIRGMVDGLAARLEQSPRDAEGWIKLIRSRVVLGEVEAAKQSLQRALSIFAEDVAERTRIADTARQLGINP
ncbi:c-type cytochrome biogenesis protein CcmI [Bradyrhizobium sp. SSBR45G]|uniref:c-type cytochrome biogenesis protein CcmI n=1 Tax=unclassified Bradyrhizobium TaxID=2631580 RepID=UPI002342BA60|nr:MULTISPECIES: c-type cytochrome biogenesis protein CcmI [unclassified Bradyrhizobium]GLH80692.1 c-type cytochrome biogenesis protein CcmI [Bradyrhizobium sp. SSBR45G]GLH88081.1 c-type cytochrome biogenesis protein CcmI [Bradyrhizobium sp. SSBR45R]